MNTTGVAIPILKQMKNPNYVFLMEHLEPAMTVDQLDRIVEKYNSGIDYKLIAKQEKRDPAEVLLALLHQVTAPRNGKNRGNVDVEKPFARRI